jgi:hypothetical protein
VQKITRPKPNVQPQIAGRIPLKRNRQEVRFRGSLGFWGGWEGEGGPIWTRASMGISIPPRPYLRGKLQHRCKGNGLFYFTGQYC